MNAVSLRNEPGFELPTSTQVVEPSTLVDTRPDVVQFTKRKDVGGLGTVSFPCHNFGMSNVVAEKSLELNQKLDSLFAEVTRLGFKASAEGYELREEMDKHLHGEKVYLPTLYLTSSIMGVFAAEVSIDVRFLKDGAARYGFGIRINIGWSGSQRNLSNALAAVSQYQRAIELAGIIEALLG
jgi:hypothetical protein